MTMRLLVAMAILLSACAYVSAQPSATDCAEVKTQLTRAQTRLNDWPQLARYHDANAKVVAPLRKEARVVFMGDSITDSWDDPKFGGFFPGKPYIDRGISGQTTPQMLVRFRADAIDLHAKVVVILAGTNDLAGNTGPMTLEEIEGNLASMAELARANSIKTVFASVLPISDYEQRDGKPIIQSTRRAPEKIRALNEWMKSYAARNKLIYLDYYSAMMDEKGFLREDLSEDGLHPNAKGYAIMAPLAEASIVKALKSSK